MADTSDVSHTVFVKGISFGTEKDALEEAFANVGPIRNCFLVRKKGEEKHKGCGYVQFALREDATTAVEQMQGAELGGRKLKVEFATKRPPLAERKRKAEEQGSPEASAKAPRREDGVAAQATKPAAKPAAAAPAAKPLQSKAAQRQQQAKPQRSGPASAVAAGKQLLVMTVAVGGIPPGRRDHVTKLAMSAGKVVSTDASPAEELVRTTKLREDGCPGDLMLVTYSSVKDAMAAVAKLHGRVLKPQALAAKPGKKGAKAAAVPAAAEDGAAAKLWARQVSGEGIHHKKWRVILRNLPFQVDEAALRKELGAAGFVWQLDVARDASGKSRGFAFASFTCRSDAERAIQLVNGKLLGKRPVAVDWAVAKSQYQAADAAAAAAAANVPPAVPPDSDAEPSGDEGGPNDAGPMSEDDSIAEEVPVEQERSRQLSVLEALLRGDSGAPAAAAPTGTPDMDADSSSDEEGAPPSSDRPAAGAALAGKPSPALAAAQVAPSQKAQQQQQQGEEEQAGQTTVFMRNLPTGATEPLLRAALSRFGPLKACRMVVDKSTGQPKGTAFVEFRRPDSAAKATSRAKGGVFGPGGEGIVVAGQKVLADLALSKEDVRDLALGKAALGKGARDRRNLYLAKEGEILEGSPAWEAVPASDRPRRQRAAADKALKLRSPSFSVSRTRLLLRNIPAAMDEKGLKKLALAAVKEHASKSNPHVKQAKLLVEPATPGGGKGPKSRGRGFVEFSEHEDALCALRQLNNNPTPFGSQHRPIVEFAIDDTRKLLVRRQRLSRGPPQRPGQQQQSAGGASRQARPPSSGPRPAGKAGGKGFGKGGPRAAGKAAGKSGPRPAGKAGNVARKPARGKPGKADGKRR